MWLCLNTFVHMLNKRATVSSISFSIFAPVSTECTYFYKPLRWILHWCGHISKFLWAQGQKSSLSIVNCVVIFEPQLTLSTSFSNQTAFCWSTCQIRMSNWTQCKICMGKTLALAKNVTAPLFNSFCHILNIHRNELDGSTATDMM